MIRKGIIVNMSRYTIERECSYDDTRVDDMFHKVDGKDLIPIAYIYPIENKEAVLAALETLQIAKSNYDKLAADIYYKVLPKLR